VAQKQLIDYTVIVPVFNEADSIVELTDRIESVFSQLGKKGSFQILFVDDGSSDDTPEIITDLCRTRSFIRSVKLRRNCGKSMALMAGFEYAEGEVIFTIDGDLQDHPEDIPRLLEKLEEGFDVVSGWRQGRKDTLTRRWGSKVFNLVVGWISGLRLHDHNCGLKVYAKRVVSSLCIYGQFHRHTPLLAHIAGFKVTEVHVENSPRKFGESKFRTFRYQGFFDLLTISFTHKFGASPLHFFGLVSFVFIIPSLLVLFYWITFQLLFLTGFSEQSVSFSPLFLILAILVLMLGGLIFMSGFICDFILHHLIRSNIETIVALQIDKVVEPGGDEREPETPIGAR